MRSLSNRTKGIICILAAAFGFALMTAFVRAAGDVPVMQKSFFRNLVAMFIASIALVRSGIGFKIEKSYRLDIFFRCLFGTSGVIANFYAIGKLGIADANMLNKLAPFFAIVLSIPLLKEVPSKVDAISTLIAFIGALFIIRPTGVVAETIPAIIAVYGGFGAGTAYVFVRRASKKGLNDVINMIDVKTYEKGLEFVANIAEDIPHVLFGETPVILVVNAKGMSMSIVPMVQGFCDYVGRINNPIKGIILNNISPMIADDISRRIEEDVHIPVVGYIPHIKDANIDSRHLGLVLPNEIPDLLEKIMKSLPDVEILR